MSNPYDQAYPDGLYPKFTFQFELHPETGNYTLFCPEWRCEIACGKYPGHSAYGLLMEIVGHNANVSVNRNEGEKETHTCT